MGETFGHAVFRYREQYGSLKSFGFACFRAGCHQPGLYELVSIIRTMIRKVQI